MLSHVQGSSSAIDGRVLVSCVQVEVVEQVSQLPPVLHPALEVRGSAAQLLCTLPLHQVAPAATSYGIQLKHVESVPEHVLAAARGVRKPVGLLCGIACLSCLRPA